MILNYNKPLPKREFLQKIYNGKIICFNGFDEINNIILKSRSLIENLLNSFHPTIMHSKLENEELLFTVRDFQKMFRASKYISDQIEKFFNILNFSSNDIFLDRQYARVVKSRENNFNQNHNDLITDPLSIHRDTWGSNIYSQINWWAPIYTLNKFNTMSLYTDFWDKSLSNDSRTFNLPSIIQSNKTSLKEGKKKLKTIPSLNEQLNIESGLKVLINPGSIIAFSGAHVHASIENNSGLTRFSFETRSVYLDDFLNSNGAKNIDGNSSWIAPGWFKRLSSKERLSDFIGCDSVCKISSFQNALKKFN